MSLSLLTAILELVTAIVTFLGSFSIKQQESESQNKILQNNQKFFSEII